MPRIIQLMEPAEICNIIQLATKVFSLVGQLRKVPALAEYLPKDLFAGGSFCLEEHACGMSIVEARLGDLNENTLGFDAHQARDNAMVLRDRFSGMDASSWAHRDPTHGVHNCSYGYTGGAVKIGPFIFSVRGTGNEQTDEATATGIGYFRFIGQCASEPRLLQQVDRIKCASDNPFIWPLLDLGR